VTDPWETVTPWRWREAYGRQAELTPKSRLEGQAQLTSIRTGTGDTTDLTVDIAAVVDLWRSWMELGGSLGQAPSPASRRPRAPPPTRPGV
jgi:hypothetical protein